MANKANDLFDLWVEAGGDEKNVIVPLTQVLQNLRPKQIKFDFSDFPAPSKMLLRSIREAKLLLGVNTEGIEIKLPGDEEFKVADQRERVSVSTQVQSRIYEARITNKKSLDLGDLVVPPSIRSRVAGWLKVAKLDIPIHYKKKPQKPIPETKLLPEPTEPTKPTKKEEPRMDSYREAHYKRLMAERGSWERTTAGLKQEIEKLQNDLDTAEGRRNTADLLSDKINAESKRLAKELAEAMIRIQDMEAKELADEVTVACPHCGAESTVKAVDGCWLITCSTGHISIRQLHQVIRRWTIVD